MNDGSKKGLKNGALGKLLDEAKAEDEKRKEELIRNLKKLGYRPGEEKDNGA